MMYRDNEEYPAPERHFNLAWLLWFIALVAILVIFLYPHESKAAGLGPSSRPPSSVGVALPGQLPGTVTNDNACATCAGAYLETVVLAGAAVPYVTTNVPVNVATLSLPAGDWDVGGLCDNDVGSITTQYLCWVSTTSVTVPTAPSGGLVGLGTAFTASQVYFVATGVVRLSLSTTTTVYLSARSGFTGTPGDVFGIIRARRIR